MKNDIVAAPRYLYGVGVDFQNINIPTAACIYYRVMLWLRELRRLRFVAPVLVETLALLYHNFLGCDEQTRQMRECGCVYTNLNTIRITERVREKYLAQTLGVWKCLWAYVPVNEYGTSEEAMFAVLNDDSRDDEIFTMYDHEPYTVEKLIELPAFDLSGIADCATVFGECFSAEDIFGCEGF